MADSYIPDTDAGARDWMQNFASKLTADPAIYQVSAADAANITQVVNAFAAAYAAVIDPASNTEVTVAEKDTARNIAEQLCRQQAVLIKYNAGVTDAAKIAAGVRPVNPAREPVNVPASSPALTIIGVTPGSQTITFRDPAQEAPRAKPPGAANLQLFVAVGDAPATDPATARFYAAATRNPYGVAFAHEDDGKVATYFGRWANRRGEVGPWSNPVSMRIAA